MEIFLIFSLTTITITKNERKIKTKCFPIANKFIRISHDYNKLTLNFLWINFFVVFLSFFLFTNTFFCLLACFSLFFFIAIYGPLTLNYYSITKSKIFMFCLYCLKMKMLFDNKIHKKFNKNLIFQYVFHMKMCIFYAFL